MSPAENVTATAPAPRSRAKARALSIAKTDIALIALALAFGAVSLTYPYGHDQALYEYVAREWVQRGAIPYRDVFDHKTPGIYVLHAITIVLFGSNEWGIRIADLAAIVGLGFVASRFATARSQPVRKGLWGASTLGASILHFGFFDYWNTAQSELWYSMLGMASIVAVRRIERVSRAQIVGGVLGGLAMVMKPPAIWFVLIAAALVVVRERETLETWAIRSAVGLTRFGLGFGGVFAIVLGYFGAHGALPAMVDIVVGANGYYVTHEREISGAADAAWRVADFFWILCPLTSILGGWLVTALVVSSYVRKNGATRDKYLLAAAGCLAGFAAVAMQYKFYWIHWLVMVAPLAGLWAMVADDFAAYLEARLPRSNVIALVSGAFVLIYASTGNQDARNSWPEANFRAFSYLTGKITREDYTSAFRIDWLYYWYRDIDDVSRWLRENSAPTDEVCVRKSTAEIYILANRRYSGRFFWSKFLSDPTRAYRRADYLAEDKRAFDEIRPKYVVALTDLHEGLESPEYYLASGYDSARVFGKLTVLVRHEGAAR